MPVGSVGSGVLDPSMPAGAHAKVPMDLSVLVLVPPSAVVLFFLPFPLSTATVHCSKTVCLKERRKGGREKEGGRRGGWRGRVGYFNTIWPYHLDNRARPYALDRLLLLLLLLLITLFMSETNRLLCLFVFTKH